MDVEIENGKLVLDIESKDESTFEQLFKDYSGESLQSLLVEFEPVGNELW